MRFITKKMVILVVAILIVFVLATSATQKKYEFPIMERITVGVFYPIEYVFSTVGFKLRQIGAFSGQLMTAYRDNQVLQTQIEQLRQENLNLHEITAENVRLRTMLDYKTKNQQLDLVTATVVSRDPGSWTNNIIINRGTNEGISKDMPVITPHGVVGHVVGVYANTAKVQLIIDPRSAVGALVQRPESRVAAIVEGNGVTPLAPRMVNISRDADVIKGDQIITSGFGGIYPKGLAVGEVNDVINDEGGLLKYAVVKPAVDFDRLEEVFVIIRSRELLPAANSNYGSSSNNTITQQGVNR